MSLNIPLGMIGGIDYGLDMVLVVHIATDSETFRIPCQDYDTFSAEIDWGDDKAVSIISTWDDADLNHTYDNAGDFIIRISGVFPNIYFLDDAVSKLKVIEVIQLGDTGLTRLLKGFSQCSNMVSFGGYANTSNVTTFEGMFHQCSGIEELDVSSLSVSAATTVTSMFREVEPLNGTIDISAWDTSNIEDFSALFYYCFGLTEIVGIDDIDTSSATTFGNMFNSCSSLAPVNLTTWNTSNLTSASSMFSGAALQNGIGLDTWDITLLTSAVSMFLNAAGLTTALYDAVLIAWEAQAYNDYVQVHFSTNSQYTLGGAAEAARNALINEPLPWWTITDGGGI